MPELIKFRSMFIWDDAVFPGDDSYILATRIFPLPEDIQELMYEYDDLPHYAGIYLIIHQHNVIFNNDDGRIFRSNFPDWEDLRYTIFNERDGEEVDPAEVVGILAPEERALAEETGIVFPVAVGEDLNMQMQINNNGPIGGAKRLRREKNQEG